MKTVFLFSRNQIRKEELKSLYDAVTAIVQKHDPVKFGVETFYNKLLEKETQLMLYSRSRVSHPLTTQIAENRQRRIELIKAIEIQLTAVNKASLASLRAGYELISPIVLMYLGNFKRYNFLVARDKVNLFIAALEKDELLREATVNLGINLYVDELKTLQEKLNSLEDIRREANAERRNIVAAELKEELLTALTNMFRSIELAMEQHAELDYLPLVAELNEFLVSYRTITKSRLTRNRNEAIKKETAALSSKTSAAAI